HRQSRVLLRQIQKQVIQRSERMLVLIGNSYGKLEVLFHRLGVQETTADGQVQCRHTAATEDKLPFLHLLLAGAVLGDISLTLPQIRQLTGSIVDELVGIILPP